MRSSSTPSLKRCWLCQSCGLLNDSVTWHCLNCECVSFIAPIYKDTIHRSNTKSTIASVACTVGAENSRTKGGPASAPFVTMEDTPPNDRRPIKCPQCFVRQTDGQLCYHRLQSRLHQCNASSRGEDCYVKQPKYNYVTRYRAIDGRYNFNGKTNRSMSSIVDAFRTHNESTTDDAFFGERIFTINYNRPNAAAPTQIASSDIKRFTHFAAKSAAGENLSQQMENGGECQSNEPMSRFTVTTLSRDTSMRTMDKNLTLPRNGGVFVAVRDWSTPTPTAQAHGEHDNYYEILKNPNNNNVVQPTYQNSNQPPKAAADDVNGTAIYAVVNKANKMKNRQVAGADSTKFTYIGMNPSTANAKTSDSFYATIRRSSPNNSSMANAINNNGNSAAGAGSNNVNNKRFSCSDVDAKDSTTHVSITSSADKPNSETSQIYAKVWKGPKKQMDSQKMYAQFPNPCPFVVVGIFRL